MSSIASGRAASPGRTWPADRVEHWPTERLIPYANNPQLHSEADLEKIAASIPRGGFSFSSCSHSQAAEALHVNRHGNKDPVFGVIGIQSGPPGQWVHSGFHGGHGSQVGDADSGDD